MLLESGFQIAPDWLQIGKIAMTSQFFDMTLPSDLFDVALFFLTSLAAGPSFMSISSLFQEL